MQLRKDIVLLEETKHSHIQFNLTKCNVCYFYACVKDKQKCQFHNGIYQEKKKQVDTVKYC